MNPTDSSPEKERSDNHANGMDGRIPEDRRDEVFFYAREIHHDERTDEWTVQLDSENCLTGYSDDVDFSPSVDEISGRSLASHEEGETTVYEGPVLLSAGVVLCVNDRFVLFERDADAPVDPLRWTSPAGRCDTTPRRTALKELYEELLVIADGRPALIVPPEGDAHEDVYDETLRRNGIHSPPEDWVRLRADVPEQFRHLYARVTTAYGEDRYVDEFWPFLDEASSTLELRKVYRIEPGEEVGSLQFEDGEYGRKTEVVTEGELVAMDRDDLVATNRAFRDIVLKDGTKPR
jgi:8-oxo-dGTP pyrophosphatase MutT (NUDIX family)